MTAQEVIQLLGLQLHPIEGGFFRETYRSEHLIPKGILTPYAAPRSVCTAIYYLLTPETYSEMHRLPGDEIFHFYLGDPVEMLQLFPDGRTEILVLGTDLQAGQKPQHVVPAGVWQGSSLIAGGKWALLGATMAPGFDYADYEQGQRELLTKQYPEQSSKIARLTRNGKSENQ